MRSWLMPRDDEWAPGVWFFYGLIAGLATGVLMFWAGVVL